MPAAEVTDLSGLVPVLFGHAAFQQLNAACELGLFELLAEQAPLSAEAVAKGLGLSERSGASLLLGTTALGLTVTGPDGYANGRAVTGAIADGSWGVLRDIVEFQARISYLPAADYAESLRTGRNAGIRHFPGDTPDLYTRLGNQPGLQELFYRCMHSWSTLSNPVLVEQVDFSGVARVLDVGGGDGVNAIALAQAHPHLQVTVLDRPDAVEVAARNVAEAGLSDRIGTAAADIFADEYPAGHDCVLYAHQLVIWSPDQNRDLLGKGLRALEPGGKALVFNAFTDDDGAGPLYAALDNVYFATLPFRDSRIYRWGEVESWLRDVGFDSVNRIKGRGWTPHGVLEGLRA